MRVKRGERRGLRRDALSRFSIGTIFISAVVFLSTAFLGTWGGIEYATTVARMEAELKADLELAADRLASSLAFVLWDVDYRQADAIALAAMGDKNIQSIEVRPSVMGHPPRHFDRDPGWNAVKADAAVATPHLLEAVREVRAKGTVVGTVRVAMTPRFLKEGIEDAMLRLAGAVLALDALMVGALYALLRFLVLLPLRSVGTYASDVAWGRPAALAVPAAGRELSVVVSSIGRMVDLMERRLLEAQESERRFKVLFEHAPDAILELNGESGRVRGANAAAKRLLGPRVGAEGVRIDDLCRAVGPGEGYHDRLARAARGEYVEFECMAERFDGNETLCAASLTPLPATGGERTLRLSLIDIGETRDLEERLRHAERLDAIGQLAGGVAHDFNNQLGGILGYAELLASRLPEGQEREWAAGIAKAVTRASGLTRQLLAYARRGNYSREPVDIHALCGETARLLERSIDKRIRIELDLGADSAVVIGDPSQLQNALLNLAINARDAMPEGGTLSFSTRDAVIGGEGTAYGGEGAEDGPNERSAVEVAVSDTGTGMDSEVKKHLFEPFFTTKGPGKGTGLGLAAVYGTVRSHHGTVAVDSVPGRGTRIALLLPLAKGLESPADSSPLPAGGERAGGAVILIDDEEPIRETGMRMLEDLGYEPIVCWDAASGLQAFAALKGRVALVILDMVLPGSSGKEIFASIRSMDPAAPVLISSGYSLDGDARSLLEAGAAGFIQKPFGKAELKEAVERAIGKAGDRVSG